MRFCPDKWYRKAKNTSFAGAQTTLKASSYVFRKKYGESDSADFPEPA